MKRSWSTRFFLSTCPHHGHLAEVALGGLLKSWEEYHRADPTYLEFRFLPGVRDALIGGRLRQEIATVRELVRQEVSACLDERRTTDDFPAIRHTSVGARAFEDRDVSIDAVVGSAAALLAALTPQAWRVTGGEVRPASQPPPSST